MPQSHAQLRHQLGLRLQRLRQRHGLTQAELARRLELSPSYLNQIERNQRPLTLAIQQRLKSALGDLDGLLDLDDPAALVEPLDASLRSLGHTLLPAELRALTGNLPQVAQALLDLHRAHQHLLERNAALELQIGVEHAAIPSLSPGEQVRDYFNRAHNYLPELDERAEALYAELGLTPENLPLRLRQRLADRHGLLVQDAPDLHSDKRSMDAQARVLWLPAHLRPGQQAFQMAAQLALLECAPLLDARIADAGFEDAERIALSRIGLSNYFAGALVMPYSAFLHSAQTSRYDIEWLVDR
ncbi:ImmA/IrrE family metallo-endopeptidase, partial [Xanthomonas perforans]